MKYLTLVAFVAAALLTCASTASAASLTSSAGSTPTVIANSTHSSWHPGEGTSFLTVTCEESSFEWKVEQHGAGVAVAGQVPKWNFTRCGNDTYTMLKSGSMSLEPSAQTGNGTLKSSGMELRIHTFEGPVCTVKTSGQDIGTVTGGTSATLEVGGQNLPLSGFLCASIVVFTGDYTFTSPSTLAVHG